MALQGTIRDFGLPDILQLIGLQRKTGELTLENDQDTVTLSFLEGQVVGADTARDPVEGRLGAVLVRTGRITSDQLAAGLKTQKNTLQRLGHILVKSEAISQEELVEALMVQSEQIIYRLFRWREGRYLFEQVENLDYDSKHFVPISAETILMEGARMTDEWPLIERRIRSDDMVLCRTEKADNVVAEAVSEVQDDLDLALDFSAAEEQPADAPTKVPENPDQIEVSAQENQVLEMVDGIRTVREVCDLLPIGEFDTFRTLADMMTKQLVEARRPTRVKAVASRPGLVSRLALALTTLALGVSVLGGVASIPGQSHTPWKLLAGSGTTEQLRLYASMARLERLEKAVRVFYLDTGSIPGDMVALASGGYVSIENLLDPWGRPYDLQISPGGYQLRGLDAAGGTTPDLTVSRRFSAAQRLMLSASEPPAAPRPSE